ncbi:hypothetical protein VTI74DRAFT_587 [Chaetomium olivicolor]
MDPEVLDALALVDAAGLPHPSGPLLKSFISSALHPTLAARYTRKAIDSGEGSSLVSDWTYIVESISRNGHPPPPPDHLIRENIAKRDGNRCCVTGRTGRFWDPLIVTPILPIPAGWVADKPRINEVLGAFFGPPYRDWWLSYVNQPEFTSPYANHWLVRRSTSQALARGLVQLERLQPSMTEYQVEQHIVGPEDPIKVEGSYALLADHSRIGIEKVDARFVGTHARLAKSIQFLEIAKSLAQQPSRPKTVQPKPHGATRRSRFHPFSLATNLFLTTWLLLPTRFRIAIYDLLHKLGALLYGPSSHHAVSRLPFGLYLKRNTTHASCLNEYTALQLLHRHTTLPVPKPLDLVTKPSPTPSDPSDPFSFPSTTTYLLTTRLPGIPLYRCQHVLTDADMSAITLQMTDYLAQLRSIPQSVNPAMAICDTTGGPIRDRRIRGEDPQGPFPDEASFNQVLRYPDDPARSGHRIVFTHADLNPRNILAERVVVGEEGEMGWRISGIVDWENSGWYPEYWDCTKSMFEGFRWEGRYNAMVEVWFKGVSGREAGYERELEVERRAWGEGDGI